MWSPGTQSLHAWPMMRKKNDCSTLKSRSKLRATLGIFLLHEDSSLFTKTFLEKVCEGQNRGGRFASVGAKNLG